jgi:hypothetical protein
MAKASGEAHSRFLLTLSPTLMDSVSDDPPRRVERFLREYQSDAAAVGVPAVNCVAEYFANGGDARFVSPPDPYHLNRQGNTLVAKHTMRWLKDNISASRSARSAETAATVRR